MSSKPKNVSRGAPKSSAHGMSNTWARADYDHGWIATVEISEKQSALAVETDPKKHAKLKKEIAARHDAITPPKMRHAAERAIRARETKKRLMLRLQRYLRRYGAPAKIGTFVEKFRNKKRARVAPPGSKRLPGPGRPRKLSHATVRAMLRSLGVVGSRGRKKCTELTTD